MGLYVPLAPEDMELEDSEIVEASQRDSAMTILLDN
jgi:hypothetical protein